MSELTERAAMALRSIVTLANREQSPDEWACAYFRGQVAMVEGYMEPDAAQLADAKRAVDQLKARQHGATNFTPPRSTTCNVT